MKKIFFNRPLKILLVTNALILIASAMMGPIYAIFVEEIGGDILDASITGCIFAVVAGLTTFIFGKFADKVNAKELIVVSGYLLKALGFFLYLFVNSIWFLFVVQVVIGLSEAVYAPAFDALYANHVDHKKSGFQWGSWETLNYLTYAFGALIGGILVKYFGFDFIFIAMAVMCLASAGYIYFLPRKTL